jgi:hypothetical protein
MAHSQPSLRTLWAFVVQSRAPPPGPSATYDARIEHVVSGQVARFELMEELPAFMIRELTEVLAQSDSPKRAASG